jgi:hypothetical protein
MSFSKDGTALASATPVWIPGWPGVTFESVTGTGCFFIEPAFLDPTIDLDDEADCDEADACCERVGVLGRRNAEITKVWVLTDAEYQAFGGYESLIDDTLDDSGTQIHVPAVMPLSLPRTLSANTQGWIIVQWQDKTATALDLGDSLEISYRRLRLAVTVRSPLGFTRTERLDPDGSIVSE